MNWGSQFSFSCRQSRWGWGILLRLPVKFLRPSKKLFISWHCPFQRLYKVNRIWRQLMAFTSRKKKNLLKLQLLVFYFTCSFSCPWFLRHVFISHFQFKRNFYFLNLLFSGKKFYFSLLKLCLWSGEGAIPTAPWRRWGKGHYDRLEISSEGLNCPQWEETVNILRKIQGPTTPPILSCEFFRFCL
jgi:hypothetical protein